MVLSHPHQDHVAGLVEVLDRFGVGALLHAGIGFENAAYDRLLADAGGAGVAGPRWRAPAASWRWTPATTLEILYPSEADAAAPAAGGRHQQRIGRAAPAPRRVHARC